MELRGKAFRKILIQRADRLGDVIFTLPVLKWIRIQYPGAEIHYLASPNPAEFLATQSLVDQVHSVNPDMGWMDVLTLARSLRRQSFDLYISLWNDPKMASLGWLANIPVRIGDSTNQSIGWVYTHTVRQRWECVATHQIEFNMQLLMPLGWRAKAGWSWHMDVDSTALRIVEELVTDANESAMSVVTFFCGTGGSNVPIPDSVIIAAVEQLSEDACVVLLGQVEAFSPLRSLTITGGINRLNQTTVSELVAWISVSDVVIGADTGPIHIAAALGRSIVFCPVRKSNLPTRFGPWTPHVEILRRDYLCRTVPPHVCLDPDCEALPRASDIVGAVERLLDGHDPMGYRMLKTLFLKESIRILVIVKSPVHRHAMMRLAKRWRSTGLVIIPVLQPHVSVFDTVQLCLRYNTLVVVCADIPRWKIGAVRLVIGIGYQYLPPVVARIALSVNEDETVFLGWVEDWLMAGSGVAV